MSLRVHTKPEACACTLRARHIRRANIPTGPAIPHCTGQWSDIFTIGSAPVLSLQETSRLAGVLNGGAPLNTLPQYGHYAVS